MNITKLASSLLSLLIAVFFLLLGIICLAIPWISSIRSQIIVFILNNNIALFLFGMIFSTIGIGIISYILIQSKHRFYQIKSGSLSTHVDETLIQQYLDKYLSELFPGYDIPSSLFLRKNKIHINMNLPNLPPKEQKPLLERLEKELAQIFYQILGYDQEFLLSISFCDKSRNMS